MRIFLGYDPRQPIAFNVASFSIFRRASRPVSIHPLILDQLPIARRGLTEFTFSRFLVPYLCGFKGWALFMDSDILCDADVTELAGEADPGCAVMAVQTDPAFERAAVMLFNCEHPDNEILTPEYVEKAEGLHGFPWTNNIGVLPSEWNHLIGYDAERPILDNSDPGDPIKIYHYTKGIPVWPETKDCEHADKWHAERRAMCGVTPQWSDIMGGSVHQPKWG